MIARIQQAVSDIFHSKFSPVSWERSTIILGCLIFQKITLLQMNQYFKNKYFSLWFHYYRRCFDLNESGKKATRDLGNNWKILGLENIKQAILRSRMSFASPSTWTRRLFYGPHPHFLPCGWLLRLVSTGHLLSPVLPKLHTEEIPSLYAEDCGFKSTY